MDDAVELVFHGVAVLVDKEDVDRVMSLKWHSRRVGYTRYVTHTSGYKDTYKKTPLHRFILGITDPSLVVDHINGNGLDNRKANLRICTQAQNTINKRMQKNNTSGFKGVTWHYKNRKWMAQITYQGKHKYIGTYSSKDEAYEAYRNEAVRLHGEFARLS